MLTREQRNLIAAALCGILLGSSGIHFFLMPKRRALSEAGWLQALSNGDVPVVEQYLDEGYHKQNKINLSEKTYLAAVNDRTKLVELLLNSGASPDTLCPDNRTLLMIAADRNNLELTRALLTHGASTDPIGLEDGNGEISYYSGPSEGAIKNGNAEILRLILEKSTNINYEMFMKSSLLIYAASRDNAELVRQILEKGAQVNSQDVIGRAALHVAVEKGNRTIAILLIDKGADVNVINLLGHTPLWDATKNKDYAMCNLLDSKGAKLLEENEILQLHKNDPSILQKMQKHLESTNDSLQKTLTKLKR